MAAQLGHVLAGIAVGSMVNEQHRFIQQGVPMVHPAERTGIARHGFRGFGGIQRAEQPAGNGKRLRAGKPHHTHSPAGGNGGDGITHGGHPFCLFGWGIYGNGLWPPFGGGGSRGLGRGTAICRGNPHRRAEACGAHTIIEYHTTKRRRCQSVIFCILWLYFWDTIVILGKKR